MIEGTPSELAEALRDRYAIERELGRGGMATVYLARDLRHDRLVALKLLRQELAGSLGPERFLREVKLAAQLDHPHILSVFDSGEAAGLLWYTMPYVEGESLRDRLRRQVQLPIEEAVQLAREVAEGLDYAHRHGLIHRDIKPENILLSEGHARVADFGVARAVDVAAGERLTETGLAIGTPAYMSHEQATATQVDRRSDIYSLGCVLYEMLTGEPPFTGPTPQAILAKRVLEPVPHVRTLRETVPAALEQALTRALAKSPADRFQSAAEFARALSLPTAQAPALGPPTPPRPRSAAKAGAAPVGLYLVAALAVLGLVRLATSRLGLPDWVFPASAALLLIGLPIVLATALVQRQHASGGHGAERHWLTWRKVVWGGVLAFTGLAITAAGYLAMRDFGVGPAGTLLATGVLKDRERLILADFGTRQADSSLGGVLTEALRIDLAQSAAVTLVSPMQVTEVLGRMKHPTTAGLKPALAREVAIREGIKGLITGQIAKAGTQYVLSAQLIAASDGEVLTAHRETAPDSTTLIFAVDRLSKGLRTKIGESLRSINRERPLERVTTASLPALRRYTAAVRAGDYEGNFEKAVAWLDEAIARDSGFAMAYRTLGMYAANTGKLDRVIEGYAGAIKRLDRLTERERYLTLGDYRSTVTFELQKAAAAYQAFLEDHPMEREALNNLGNVYFGLRQYPQAESLYKRALDVDSLYVQPNANLIVAQLDLKKWPEAEASYRRAIRRFPEVPVIWFYGIPLAEQRRDYTTAEARSHAFKKRFGADPNWRATADREIATLRAVRGRLREAERYLRSAMAGHAEAVRPDAYLVDASVLALVVTVVGGEPTRGLREVDRGLAQYPLDSLRPMDRPYIELAWANVLAGRADRARALVTRYERVTPPQFRRRARVEVGLTWGRIALAERRWPDAIAKFKEAASAGISPIFGMPDLGHAYDLAGETDSAIAVYERFLATPDFIRSGISGTDAIEVASIQQRLGELYERRGKPGNARESYSRFVELWKDCDPELRPRLTEARRALERLTNEPRS